MEKLHFHELLYLSVTWFFRNHSNVDLVLNKHLLLPILKQYLLLNIFVETVIHYCSDMWGKQFLKKKEINTFI